MGLLCMFLLLGTAFAQSDDPNQDYERKAEAKEVKPETVTTPWGAFIAAITSIVVSELGDKTFFIAAIMSMRYNRMAVFGGAIAALVIMTGISTAFGWIVPILIPPRITQIIVTVLFFFFGAKLLYDVYTDDGKDDHDEAAEAEEEIDKAHSQLISKKKGAEDPNADVELRTTDDNSEVQMMVNKDDPENPTVAPSKKVAKAGIAVAFIFWQALTLTFLGEWGDRSQITTIALASQSSAAAVFFGASLGHAMCTGLAVIGGKYLAKSISERWVNISGGLLFLVFGIHNLFSI